MDVTEIESLSWGSVRIASENPENIYVCPLCTHGTVVHSNYIKYKIPICVRYATCNKLETVVNQLVYLRNATLVKLDKDSHRPYVEFKRAGSDHVCRMTYETLRKGGVCKTCLHSSQIKKKAPRAPKLIRPDCDCKGARKGSKPHACIHYNFAVAYPNYAKFWDHDLNDVGPDKIAPMSKTKRWFKCLDGVCNNSAHQVPGDIAYKNIGCPFCCNNKVCYENSLAVTHPELCLELDVSNSVSPEEVTHGTRKLMRWKCSMGHIYEMRPTDRIKGHGCVVCKHPGYEQMVGGYDHFVLVSNKVHNNKYTYPGTYIGNQVPIEIHCPEQYPDGSLHGIFMQQPAGHKNGQGCPTCSAYRSESKGSLAIRKVLERCGFVNGKTYFSEKQLEGLRHVLPLRLDFYLPEVNLAIEYDGKQHFTTSGWGDADALSLCKKRDVIKDSYCISRKISIIRIPYYLELDVEMLESIIEYCKLGNLVYGSYSDYVEEVKVNLSLDEFLLLDANHYEL